MKVQNDIDFTTLNWVKQELDETLKQARQALEAYVEDTADKSQMRFCASYLHQVQGTLRMVELYGAAMVVEEMERLALGILEGEIKQTDDAYGVLMRGMVQMPDYLERLQSGHRDIPIVLLPLLNDLRACRGENLLTETALFSPDLSLPLPVSAAGPGQPLAPELLRTHAAKLRLAYQFGLLKWFKGDDVSGNLARLIAVLDRFRVMTAQIDARRLWWVAGNVLDGVLQGVIDPAVAVKLLFGKVDREIKHLIDQGERGFGQAAPLDLTRGLLYYAAHAQPGNKRVDELKQIFQLASLLPSDSELEHARGALTGHNRALLDTVGQNIKDDLLRVKDALDLFLRTAEVNVSDMGAQAETLHRVGDTLGMLGLGVPRRVVLEQREVLEAVASGRQQPDEQVLLDVAGALLYVESSLDDYIERLGQGTGQAEPALSGLELPQAEVRRILDATMKEASVNIQQAKHDIVAFIESPWEHARIEQIPRLMEEIGGALRMLNLSEPAGLIDGVIRFTEVELLKHRRVPTADQLDLLADAMASIEYYLEAVRETRPNRDKILEVTRRSLEALGYWPVPSVEDAERASESRLEAAQAPQPQFPSFEGDFLTGRESVSQAELAAEPAASDVALMPTVELPGGFDSSFDSAVVEEQLAANEPATPEMRSAVEIAPGEGLDGLVVGEPAPAPVEPGGVDTMGLDFGFELEPRAARPEAERDAAELSPIDLDSDGSSSFELDQLFAPEPPATVQPVVVAAPEVEPPTLPVEESAAQTESETTADHTFSWIEELAQGEEEPVLTESPAAEVFREPEPQLLVEAPAPAPVPVASQAPAPAPVPAPAPAPAVELPASGFSAVPSDEIDDEIREVFVEEVQDVLGDLQQQYPVWKADLNDFEKLKPVRRSFHTLKGSGRLVGALAIGEFSWKIENMLNRVLDKSIPAGPPVLDLLDKSIEALPQLLAALRGEGNPTANIGGLMWVADRVGAGEDVYLPKPEPVALAEPAVAESEVTAGPVESIALDVVEVADVSDISEVTESAENELEQAAGGASAEVAELADSGSSNHEPAPDGANVDMVESPEAPVLATAVVDDAASHPTSTAEIAQAHAPDNHTAAGLGQVDDDAEHDLPQSLALDPMLAEILRSEAETHNSVIRGWLEPARALHGNLPISDDLLRAVHTLNGAVSMVDLPVLSHVMAPLEAYLKRLRSRSEMPRLRGTEAIAETSVLIQRVMDAVEHGGGLHHINSDALALEIQHLRDDLPDHEPSLAILTGAIPHEELAELGELDLAQLDLSEPVQTDADGRSDVFGFGTVEPSVADTAAPELADADSPATRGTDEQSIAVIDMSAFEEPESDGDAATAALEAAGSTPETLINQAFEQQADELSVTSESASRPWWEVDADSHTPDADELAAVQGELDSLFGQDELDVQAIAEMAGERSDADVDAQADVLSVDASGDSAWWNSIGQPEAPEAAHSEEAQTVQASTDSERSDDLAEAESLFADSATEENGDIDSWLNEVFVDAPDASVTPVELAIADEAIADEAIADEAIADEAIADEAIADEAIADEAIADEAIADEAIADDAIADEAIADEAIADDAIADEAFSEQWSDLPSEAQPASASEQPQAAEAAFTGMYQEPAGEATTAGLLSAAAALALDQDPNGALDLPDVDAELLEIFVQEGGDILDQSDSMMARLRETPDNRELVVGLQRELHTLKGGARMAGLAPIGDLSHAMESLFESVVEGRAQSTPLTVEALERAFDRLHAMVQRVGKGLAIGHPEHTIARLDALADGREAELLAAQRLSMEVGSQAAKAATSTDTSPAAVEEPSVAAAAPAPAAVEPARTAAKRTALDEADDQSRQQEVVRVRADLLDNLVNYAGEVSIYRSRLEAQIGGFRFNLQEFEQTVTRLRDQLRKLEIETEAQIIARFQRESESANKGGDFDPLELDRFSTLQQLSRALAESVSDLVSLQGLMDDIARQSETLLLQQSRVSSDLQEGLMRTRMVPFDSLVPRLRRIIRQTAGELGKKAQLKVEGAQGEMDRTVLERMTAPLEHMLRNALAHGLESPEVRRASGKPEEGSITINVSREATEVVIKVSDDGAGMNRDAIRRKAIERGLLREDTPLSDRDLFQFILEQGFSTAEQVSKIAGRGVGMDVVNSEIRQLGGVLVIDSERGKGSVFTVRLPFTLSVTQAILVRLADQTYAVPMSSVAGVMRLPRKELDARLGRNDMELSYAGETFQLYDLGDLLGTRINHPQDELQAPILMTKTGDQRAAIRVTGVVGSKEVVVKSMGLQLASVAGFFGATIMGDGSVVVILDLAPLVRHGVAVRSAPELARELDLLPEEPVAPVRKQPLVMVVDDSITMRKVTTRVLERNDLEVMTAKDGLDAVEQLQDRVPDLMLLDIEMPRMDGYELATYVRNDSRLKHIPIIMITSRTGEKHRQRALEIGVDRYLGKPYQEVDLLKNVQEALSHGRSTQPAL